MASESSMPRCCRPEHVITGQDAAERRCASPEALRRQIELAHRGSSAPLIMGILNATPDSFSDGGAFSDLALARQRAETIAREGAAIIDVGGESTRPDAKPVPQDEEWGRISAALEAATNTGCAVSCDTYKAEIARRAVMAGSVMINDVGGMLTDPLMPSVIAESNVLIVIMHGLRDAMEGEVTDALSAFFERATSTACKAGVSRTRIILDPGLGFNKSDVQNIECFNALPKLKSRFDLPLLVGVSRKSMIGRLTGRDIDARLAGSLAAAVIAAQQGAAIIRVHDIAPHLDAMRVTHAFGVASVKHGP